VQDIVLQAARPYVSCRRPRLDLTQRLRSSRQIIIAWAALTLPIRLADCHT
jgi:hypothetical protein